MVCNHCKEDKAPEEFAKNQKRCKSCHSEANRASRARHPERNKERMKSYWQKKRDELGVEAFLVQQASTRKMYRARLRAEFLEEYGGKCTCCGEMEPAFLCLEHTQNDGAQHRAQFSKRGARGGSSTQLLEDLKRRGWPKDGYTILCYNCNNAKAKYGQCPHQHH